MVVSDPFTGSQRVASLASLVSPVFAADITCELSVQMPGLCTGTKYSILNGDIPAL
ncbi:unnamed protein product [Gulo gulo]|uniref:Uncharacterized protein n=1 Tax=Gulo gulo TaxID=48420 RepID=A0A9X9M583_GULGU|nr:unnamed protein product [Gulo gulo]